MPGPFPYFRSFYPPWPGCAITLSYDRYSGDYEAIIDSAADMTCVPEHIITAFSLKQVSETNVGGVTDKNRHMRGIYHINLEFLGLAFPHHLVVSIAGTEDKILIGRDILNRYRVILDGRAAEFTIE